MIAFRVNLNIIWENKINLYFNINLIKYINLFFNKNLST